MGISFIFISVHMATFHNLFWGAKIPTIWENINLGSTFLGFFSIAFQMFIIEDGNQLYSHQYPCGHLSQPLFLGKNPHNMGKYASRAHIFSFFLKSFSNFHYRGCNLLYFHQCPCSHLSQLFERAQLFQFFLNTFINFRGVGELWFFLMWFWCSGNEYIHTL